VGYQIKKDGMNGTCSTHGRNEKFVQYYGWKNLKGKVHSEDLGVDGKIILECILGK
jgi:hypothetical protein